MRIRTQLLLAFLLLAVLPLVGIVGFSYLSSKSAMGRAAAAEAAELSADMEQRMSLARERLQARMLAVPWDAMVDGRSPQQLTERIEQELGDFAPMLEGLTFVPAQPAPPEPPEAAVTDSTSEPTDVEPVEPRARLSPAPPGLEIESEPAVSPIRVFVLEHEDDGAPIERRFEYRTEPTEARESEMVMPPPAIEAASAELEGQAFRSWQQALEQDQEAARRKFEAEFERSFRELEEQRTRLVFGQRALEIRRDGELVGALKPRINPERLLARVFRGSLAPDRAHPGEMAFAIDRAGRLYSQRPEDRHKLDALDLEGRRAGESWRQGDWVIAMSTDEPTGLRLGVARPIGEAMRELRSSALRNLSFGLALIAFAVLGILPVSNRLSRDVQQVAAGAERIARGDLETRLPVRGSGELAHLSRAFNSMVQDVRHHQERLLAEERRRLDQAVESELMRAELDRQSRELDEARAFQLSMLPRELPEHDLWQAAVFVETATEVGGDYYDFRRSADGAAAGALTVVVGDATGHGARAGTMVTVIKSLFSAHSTSERTPKEFLTDAGETVRRMQLGRMAMALAILRLEERHVVLSNAGMPPVLHHRAEQAEVHEILVPGMPLGALASNYQETRFTVEPGDTLLLYSDGLPEQPDAEGTPFGYERVSACFARLAGSSPQAIVEALAGVVRELTGDDAPKDDVTFLVLRRRRHES